MKNIGPRKCPKCNKDIFYSRIDALERAVREDRTCHQCRGGWTQTEETKKRVSLAKFGRKNPMFGKHLSDEEKEKKSIACTGWKQTEEAKEKIRIAALERAAEKGIVSYNVDACRYIDEFNRIFGFQCQHALNGGETHIRGYSLDGYDKARGIIIEYDEPFHNKPYVKRKDLVRQEQIREAVKPVMFLRYDEQHHRLYDSLTGISIQKL